jgi:uncharacterized tellurite resistance protein B-like protein
MLNKDIAGFHILSILSETDGDFNPAEGLVIVDYLEKNFPLGGNFDDEIEVLSTLNKEDYGTHLKIAAEAFYKESTPKERIDFLKFALKLIRADEKIAREEDKMISRLFEMWDI